jgi:hypothetical protein
MTILSDELRDDPKGIGYKAHMPQSPGIVVDLLNAPTQSMVKPIESTTAQAWAASGPYAAIVDAGANTDHPCRASCLMLRDTIISRVPISMDAADVQEMFAAWVQTGVITQAQHDDLYTRATQPASRAEVLGLGFVTMDDLINAGVFQ